MRFLISIIACFFGIIANGQTNREYKELPNHLTEKIFTDSIRAITDGRPFILFNSGGRDWIVATVADKYYIVAKGNIRNNHVHIDTVHVNPILKWAFGELPSAVINLTPIYRSEYTPFVNEIYLYSAEQTLIYSNSDILKYSGIGCMSFNNRLARLLYFLFWSAFPIDKRNLLPPPMNPEFLPPHKSFE